MTFYNSFPIFLGIALVISLFTISKALPKVVLVNVVFRHGDRTPDAPDALIPEMYPNDPYINCTFFPVGHGGLTNQGKRREYTLGKVLHNRYKRFLGPIYVPEAVRARSTDFDRTKMSLELVLGALYPPVSVQLWNKVLPWQPIPTTYVNLLKDTLFASVAICPKYAKELQKVQGESEVKAKINQFSDLMEFLTEKTGKTINTTMDLYVLYQTFVAESSMHLTLPDWTENIFPFGELFDATVFQYELWSYNRLLQRLNGGMLLRQMLDSMLEYSNGSLPSGRKIYLYSGHEVNVAAVLSSLQVFKPHVPEYSSAVILELLKSNNDYYVKVLHYLGIPPLIEEVAIPGCNVLCPLKEFVRLTKDVIPSDEEFNCTPGNGGEELIASTHPTKIIANLGKVMKDPVRVNGV